MENTHYWCPQNRGTGRKPTVLVDVDGPLAAFDRAAVGIVNELTGKQYTTDDIKTWEIFESIEENNPAIKSAVYARMKAEGGCLGISVNDGAQAGIEKLRQVADLVIVTAPFWGGKTWVYEREKWLHEHFNISGYEVVHARQKYHVAGDMLVDDRLSHLEAWAMRFPQGRPLLWATKGNRDYKGSFTRVSTWEEVIALLPTV